MQGKRTAKERESAESQWHQDLAEEVHKIWDSAAGGVLVLCTSYATVGALHALLSSDSPLSSGLVKAVSRVSVGSQAKEFLTHSRDGRKPLWLAVGSAWTGVDIGGHSPWEQLFGEPLKPELDNVLTDLVIPRLPYGTNQSLSHLWRVRNNPNVPWDLLDASLRFKQALGRLVRREGLPANRRIHVLDARMGDPVQKPRLVPFLKSLTKYRLHEKAN
jgi:CRISPR type IV-associated DEAD/DEAH-box helicase Csf4